MTGRLDVGREEGAVAVLVAVLLVVLLGFAALAIDISLLTWERAQLQNGADAGSLAVAEDCAHFVVETGEDCALAMVDGELTATDLADRNAVDGESDIEFVELGAFDGVPLSEAGKVTVRTLVSDDGENELQHVLAPVLGIDSSRVVAQAAAVYGPVVEVAGVLPIAICEDIYPDEDDLPSDIIDIVVKGTGPDPPENDCIEDPDNFNPGTQPGNFGWLETDDCEKDFHGTEEEPQDASGETGAGVPGECTEKARELEEQLEDVADAAESGEPEEDWPALPRKVLAIYEHVEGSGTNANYRLVEVAAFEFWGMAISAQQGPNIDVSVEGWNDNEDCENNQIHCVQGKFVKHVVGDGEVEPEEAGDVLGVQLVE